MKKTLHAIAGAAALIALLAAPVYAEQHKETPDGTIHLESKSVAVGVGFSWGKGTLKYKGKEHDLSVEGLTVGAVGASEVSAVGEVYHLKKLEDFDGTYTAVSAGAAAGGGGGVLAMRNQNGVVIEVRGTSQGIKLEIGVSGVKLAVKK
jgi:hypothetical protein